MPPIRSAKKNSGAKKLVDSLPRVDRGRASANAAKAKPSSSTSDASNPVPAPDPTPASSEPKPKKTKPTPLPVPKTLPEGVNAAEFPNDGHWEKDRQRQLGRKTRRLSFGWGFVLTDRHIDQLIAMGPNLCWRLTHFEFEYSDVTYTAHNKNELTNAAVIKLAKACPGLKRVQLQGTYGLTDEAVAAFFENCDDLSYLEVTSSSSASIGNCLVNGTAFDTLRENPDWCPGLKTMRLTYMSDSSKEGRESMKAMRALSRARENLKIELVHVSERKKWGDWELEVWHEEYKKGRKVSKW